jgi:UDPglucose 6-dehydrogenase
VLGLAYKPLSHVIDESPGIYLCRALSEAGYRVIGHDNLAATNAEVALKLTALVTDSIEEALKDADVVLVATTDKPYLALTAELLLHGRKSVTVVDFWRCLKHFAADPRIKYVPVGLCLDDTSSATGLKTLWSS